MNENHCGLTENDDDDIHPTCTYLPTVSICMYVCMYDMQLTDAPAFPTYLPTYLNDDGSWTL